MAKSCHLYVFLLVTSLAAKCSAAGIVYKSVCIGDSVEVFQSIASPNFKIKISLYKTSESMEDLMAVWFVQNSSKDASIRETYKAKLLFENETILIRNILSTDEATYMILYDINGYLVTKRVQIYVLAPPTEPCKLKIKHEENILIASLDDPKYCGKPVASVSWMDYPGIFRRSKAILELPPGKDAGTYYACLEGDAVKCVKNSSDWKNCEYVTIGSIGGNRSPQASEIIHGLNLLIQNTSNQAVRTAVNLLVEQLKDVVVKPIIESNVKQLARLEEMYKKTMDEKQMAIDEKQKVINEKEVLLQSMNATITHLESKMENLEACFDDLEQNGLGSSIRLNNVMFGKDESCEEKVVDVITNMANVSISRDDIERCHPLGKPNKNGNRQLMIKFKSYKTKSKVFSQRKKMKRNHLGIYIIDDLPRPKPDLLHKLLKYKTSNRIAAFWIADGKIYAIKYPGSYPKRINTMQDIEHLLVKAESSLFAKNEEKH